MTRGGKLPILGLTALALLSLVLSIQKPTGEATLALLGDVMLGRTVAAAHAGGGWEEALAAIRPELAAADLALANLESPVTALPLVKESYDLRAAPESLAALTGAGLDLLSVANNHSLDAGPEGLAQTRAALHSRGLQPVGGEDAVVSRRVNGVKLAFLAFDDAGQALDVDKAAAQVAAARRAGAVVIVSMHWGQEYMEVPTGRQVDLAQRLAESGAALVWGHHPHVQQPVAWVQAGERRALVAYSLGNALFDQGAPPDARRGALLRVQVTREGVESYEIIPFKIAPLRGRVEK